MAPRARRTTLARCLSLLLPVGVLGASLFAGCSNADDGAGGEEAAPAPPAEGAACLSNRQFFEQRVWGAFLAEKCAKCHTPDGPANADKPTDMVLQPASYPGFLDANLAQLSLVARTDVDGKSKLLEKPLGRLNHQGGPQIAEGTPEHAALVELTTRLRANTDPCPDAKVAALPDIELLGGPATLRKVSLDLAGRLPTADELAAVDKPGAPQAEVDAALDARLDALLTEPVFLERLDEMFNDLFLTDKFLAYGGAAVDFMDVDKHYPGLKPYKDCKGDKECGAFRGRINTAIAREPLLLIRHVVSNDRPFSEILTAPYAVVNPYTAAAYGVNPGFTNASDESELKEVQVTLGTGVAIPHAGVLSTPSFLNRWQTSRTNVNRARARRVFQFFLATDVLRIAERPVDASKAAIEDNPTLRSSACNVCHRTIDPVAGSFRGYDDQNYEDFDPARPWRDDMAPPGFGAKDLPPDQYGKGLPWLAQRVVEDPRFVISVIYTVYTGLTGHRPLPYPTDAAAADHAVKLVAWNAQDAFFRKVAADFQAANLNLKAVVKAIVKSPYYRGVGVKAEVKPESAALLADVGTGRFLTPEMLNRKISAVTGIRWRKQYEFEKRHDWLDEDFEMLYGGIDSDSAPVRLSAPNGISTSVAWRMAAEVSCSVTAYEFTRPKDQRLLFPLIDKDEVPESAGHSVDGAVKSIRGNLVYLFDRVLGQKLAENDPEIDRAYAVFLDTWREVQATGKEDMEWACWGRIDPNTGVELPKEQHLGKDKTFTIRAWMAVLNYLLIDYRFLYQ